jgi:demethylmenaquinone methyltransferase/2-methoxy-6-polyprenyl-1,4-benzoquinol methylase
VGSQPLKKMFDAVPRRYDALNRLLTLRFDERWRARAAARCLAAAERAADRPVQVLDLCCGTGDLALELGRRADSRTAITGLDYSAGMLELARAKAARRPGGRALQFVEGDAAELPFGDQAFDAAGTAFAFRNVTWRNPLKERVLAEVRRVLKPGGAFVIVETSQPPSRLLQALFHAYLRLVAAPVGTWISGHRSAYRYLSESARGFYSADEVVEMLAAAGFTEISYTRLLGGVAALHVAHKP